MIVLTYLDAYKTQREVSYDDLEAFRLSLSGCVILPDSYQVLTLTCNGKDTGYKGFIGDLYRASFAINWQSFDEK